MVRERLSQQTARQVISNDSFRTTTMDWIYSQTPIVRAETFSTERNMLQAEGNVVLLKGARLLANTNFLMSDYRDRGLRLMRAHSSQLKAALPQTVEAFNSYSRYGEEPEETEGVVQIRAVMDGVAATTDLIRSAAHQSEFAAGTHNYEPINLPEVSAEGVVQYFANVVATMEHFHISFGTYILRAFNTLNQTEEFLGTINDLHELAELTYSSNSNYFKAGVLMVLGTMLGVDPLSETPAV